MVRQVLSQFANVLVGDQISAKKLANARAACRIPDSDTVIGLIDCTVFGSAKHAVVFAGRIYICDRWTNGVVQLEYTDLQQLVVSDAGVTIGAVHAPRASLAKVVPVLLALQLALAPVHFGAVEEDIGSSPIAVELQAAIAADPGDEGPQLVLADLLLSAEDPRGELIMLDNLERSTPGGLTDPEALERYLLLAAEYSFPRATPDELVLQFTGVNARYSATHEATRIDLRYSNRELTARLGERTMQWRLELERSDTWTADETIVILRLVSDAVRAGSPLHLLQFPFSRDPLPVYDGGPLRAYPLPKDFTKPRGISPRRYGLAARDYQRWMEVWRRLVRSEALARR
ncbi:MAG: hypothetical protein ABI867_08655 [Kofleriaceae bacterium]